jgi:peptidoglycan/LPS O-acetylase OafA/YrhL
MRDTVLYSDYRNQKHFKGLDGIRCLSIVAVMYFHFTSADGRLGILGVDLFFILSGFLITTLLLRERENTGEINLKLFWVRRALRIFPIYYGFILAQLIIFKLITIDQVLVDEFYKNLPAFLTFTNNWFVHLSPDTKVVFYHAWSLAAEEQFYLFWPLLLVFAGSTKRLISIPAILILMDVLFTYLTKNQVLDLTQNGTAIVTSLQPAICLGVIAAILMHHQKSFNVLSKLLNSKVTSILSAVIAIILIIYKFPNLIIHVTLTLFLLSVIFNKDKITSSILNFRPVIYIGQISYGMYIFHMAAFNAVSMMLFPSLSSNSYEVVVTSFIFTILVATASYYLYEKPFMSLKTKFQKVK